ncbi:alkaline phosphatase family protein [Halorussus halophilus]|uniref:alkaline phosphatase family protein n=1 Tax=Halorussus halophilus TaxID=2650975 RepID=UPI00130171DF|nr:nucleotide pyrophosphatase/phosphodiesterase family protein [Halorussus halophilus]
MLRDDLAASLREECEEDGYLFPDYGGYCFARVPQTIASVLGTDFGRTLPEDVLSAESTDSKNVLVVLVDGFGYEQWRRERDHHPFLDRLTADSRVTPLTSIYPSETSAAIPTFHTGALPAEHGVVGWNIYEPTTDEEFEALPFQTKDGETPKLPPEELLDAEPLYPELADAGVESHHVIPFPETLAGATAHSYDSLGEVPEKIEAALDASADSRSYCYCYLPQVDHAGHEYGTHSEGYRQTVGDVFEMLEAAVSGIDDETANETLLVVTADHGHVNTDPERNVDISEFEAVTAALKRHANDTPVKFSGSPRNLHLHLEGEESAERIAGLLREELDAKVLTKADVLEMELCGSEASETFRRRLGDVVVTHRNLGVWWADEEPDELELVGMHGGLTPEEMLVPLATVGMDELR